MPVPRHSRRTALVTALAGFVALVLAAPAHATYPGRNGLIAFYSSTDHGAQIFTVRPNGRDLRQITHVSGDASNADWSRHAPPPDPGSLGLRPAIHRLGTERTARRR